MSYWEHLLRAFLPFCWDAVGTLYSANQRHWKELEELNYKVIVWIILKNIRQKRLVVFERTKFIESKRNPNESIVQYMHRLKDVSKYCEFEKLWKKVMTMEDE